MNVLGIIGISFAVFCILAVTYMYLTAQEKPEDYEDWPAHQDDESIKGGDVGKG